jgi:exodeoxyribonuclease X
MRYLIYLDTETSSLPEEQPTGNIIIQFAFIIFDQYERKFVAIKEVTCTNEFPMSTSAMTMHHITPESITDYPKFKDTIEFKYFESFIESNRAKIVLIAHNLPFDYSVLNRVFNLEGILQLDTLKVARLINDQMNLPWKSCSLQYLKYENKLYLNTPKLMNIIGLEKTLSAHDAMSDIIDLILLVSYFQKEYNATIETMLNITKSPLMLKYMPSGKDRGVKMVDLSYNQLVWHSQNSYDDAVKYTCFKLLNEN